VSHDTIADANDDTVANAPTPAERLATAGSVTVRDLSRTFRQWPAVFMAVGLTLTAAVTWVAWPEEPTPTPRPLSSRPTERPAQTETPEIERPARVEPPEAKVPSRRAAAKARHKTPAKAVHATKSKRKPARATGRLTLDSKPWANVYINQRLLGPTPLVEHTLPAGKVTVRLVNPELGVEKTMLLDIPANDLLRTTIRLER
jgi:hypothetical protein